MDAGKDECRERRMHERRESRLEGYRKGGIRTGEIPTEWERCYSRQEG